MAVRYTIAIAALLMLGACGTTATNAKSNTKTKITAQQDRLAPRDLNTGECGIFVWTADPARRFVFFSQMDSATASWWSDSGEVEINRISSNGLPSFGQLPDQTYQLPDGAALKLKLNDPEDVDNGTRYRSGAITQTAADGWEKVVPVSGIAACNVKPVGAEYSMRTIR